MNLIPRNDLVVVQPDPPTARGADIGSKSLILMPQQGEEPACTGKIIASGPKALDVKPGQRVKFHRYAGVIFDNVEFGGEFTGLRLMKESEIEVIL